MRNRPCAPPSRISRRVLPPRYLRTAASVRIFGMVGAGFGGNVGVNNHGCYGPLRLVAKET